MFNSYVKLPEGTSFSFQVGSLLKQLDIYSAGMLHPAVFNFGKDPSVKRGPFVLFRPQ